LPTNQLTAISYRTVVISIGCRPSWRSCGHHAAYGSQATTTISYNLNPTSFVVIDDIKRYQNFQGLHY